MQSDTISICPGSLRGAVTAPPSKSVMQRICAAIWVRGGSIRILNPGRSADDLALLALMESAGCTIRSDASGALRIDALKAASHTLDRAFFGESGLAARMCIPILALAGRRVLLEGQESLSRRPMQFFETVLPQLGVSMSLQDGHLPGAMSGRLEPSSIVVDGSLSSQFVTGLLMAYSGAGAREVTIGVQNPVSRPYMDLTLAVMRQAGLPTPTATGEGYYFDDGDPAPALDGILQFTVEGDWSSAGYWLVAGAIAGPLVVKGLDVFSEQADKALLSALMDCGARLSIESEQISVGPAPLRAFQFDARDCPDLFPALAVLACYASGTSVIEGVGRLRHKESDRAATICSELGKMGAEISLQDDLMIIRGGQPLCAAEVDAHDDHRIAMMCAIAALGATGPAHIRGASAVDKSYPQFFADLAALGGDCS